jgi:hypothetical protein
MIVRFGIIVTTPGIIMVARYSLNTRSLPLHLGRENAYAAMALVRHWSRVTHEATKMLLK